MKLSARNQLKGTVTKVDLGPISAEVVLDLGGGQTIVAVITRSSAEAMGLAVGQTAYAVVKASSVMMAVD